MTRTTASRRLSVRDYPYVNFLDGNGDYWDFGDNYAFERTDAFSVFGFFTATAFDSQLSSILRKSSTTTDSTRGWFVSIGGSASATFEGDLTFYLANSTSNRVYQGLTSASAIKLRTRYFFGVSYDGSSDASGVSIILIPAGTPLTAFNTKGSPITNALSATTVNTQVLRLGMSSNGLRPFTGNLGATGIANTALTLAEFQDFYYDGKLPASTQSFWLGPDTDGQGSTLTDEVGSIDGTLGGDTTNRWNTRGMFSPRLAGRPMTNSITFNAATDNVSWADDAAFDVTNITVECWIKPTDDGLFASKYGASGNRSWFFDINSTGNVLDAAVFFSGVVQRLTTTAAVPFNQWSHVVMTFDGSLLIAYLNGKEVGRLSASGTIDITDTAVRLGRSVNAADGMTGKMALFRMFGSAATRAQVADLYYRDKKFATPILETLMTEGSGTSLGSTGSLTTAGSMTSVDWDTSDVPIKMRSAASLRTTAS